MYVSNLCNKWMRTLAFVVLAASGNLLWAADSAADLNREANAALARLYENTPIAKTLAAHATAVLIFPSIVKGGFVLGAQYGKGVLREKGKTVAYYKTSALSYGLQAGAQSYGYALILMTPKALKYLKNSKGWEIGVGPSVVLVDEGVAKSLTTTTTKDDIYAFIFGQKGLMAGIGIQGSKITRIHPGK
jgi:lipid-binding SYLF domain-containing protein